MNKKELIVITGASSGLGEQLLKSFSKSHKIINISRTKSKCEYNIVSDFGDLSGLKIKLEKNKFDVIVNILPLFGLLLSIYLVTIFTLYEQSVLTYKLYPWINIEYFSANIGYLIDQMSSVMIFVVCSISFLIKLVIAIIVILSLNPYIIPNICISIDIDFGGHCGLCI